MSSPYRRRNYDTILGDAAPAVLRGLELLLTLGFHFMWISMVVLAILGGTNWL